ncbi:MULTISPECIES: M23 family metallopeptidase [Microbacterium]|uniref:M23 family metallopeptidase n=1 Tax=Microbacterium TaxID=33882 RepID=UPI002785FA8B|nr:MULTISPECIES: M23 family metallopeptidase [Microbacterium]MDQ1076284.1 murein DD-endopeptidase MepM/ murein hydrolase activator NlpD [Microbacterium sp. SORGH_AS_0969]MDQ1116521.1 murein DD-endopeptidase MepM/ murein hydrolase activator NlpD [Microbacterium testaceum]
MAEHTHPVDDRPEVSSTGLTRKSARAAVARPSRRTIRPTAPAASPVPRTAPPARSLPAARRVGKPLRSAVILSMVAGLVATVAIPAYAATVPPSNTVTLGEMSAPDNQSMVVASDVASEALDRSSYSATTADEIQKKKDQEAAAAAAAERARQLAASAGASLSNIDLNMTAPGSGEVRWPLTSYVLGRGLWDSGYHQGVDLLAPGGQPIFAAAAGVVSTSSESFGGYGVGIVIEHVINGQKVSTTYGHMTYGSRQVQAGDTVAAGQLIGLVGSTGSSTANHLHFEVHINGQVVDPYAWLQQNAG